MARSDLSFFDPSKARGPREGPDVGRDVTADITGGGEPAAPLSVSGLLGRVKAALAGSMPQRVAVLAEISNVKLHGSGHLYFRLKDEHCAIDAVMWRAQAARLKFRPLDGLEVVAEGRVDVYDVRGQLQLYVERLTPRGEGALELAFRQLKEKLEAEGLFDPARKKPIAPYPRAVGIVTSDTGAALRDIRRTLARRWPAATVYLAPALVQGQAAARSVADALAALDAAADRLEIDTILVARGGGSLEDLWPFNEEPLARAVAACRTPVISGVGHEVDVTICDLVADARAATPTAAAEMAVPDAAEARQAVSRLAQRLGRAVMEDLVSARAALAAVLRSAAFRHPTARVRTHAQRVDELSHRLTGGLRRRLAEAHRRLTAPAGRLAALHPAALKERASGRVEKLLHRLRWALGRRARKAEDRLGNLAHRLDAAGPARRVRELRQQVRSAERQLEALSYRNVLRRGYSVTRDARGRLMRSIQQVRPGETMQTQLADGTVHSEVSSATAATPAPPAPAPRRTSRGKGRPPPGPTLFDS